MKAVGLREQTEEELRQRLRDTEQELIGARVKRRTVESGVQPLRLRTLRREVARIKTIMRERNIQ